MQFYIFILLVCRLIPVNKFFPQYFTEVRLLLCKSRAEEYVKNTQYDSQIASFWFLNRYYEFKPANRFYLVKWRQMVTYRLNMDTYLKIIILIVNVNITCILENYFLLLQFLQYSTK